MKDIMGLMKQAKEMQAKMAKILKRRMVFLLFPV